MKIKVNALLERKTTARNLKDRLGDLDIYEESHEGDVFHVTDEQMGQIQSVLSEYVDLLTAIINSAEVEI